MNSSARNVRAMLGLIAGLGATSLLSAQVESADSAASTVKLDKYVVTGSYLPPAADAPATEITVLSSVDIAKTGVSGDLLEVLRKTVPQLVGAGNIGSDNANVGGSSTNGGSQVLLRNTNTLVLINGRRAAFAPASATGGYTFVDVGAIPVSAVERVEVLTDGASALYGSDAVSGVVNVILKKKFEGAQFGGGYKFATQDGNWEERSASFTVGTQNGKTSMVVAGEWVKQDPLYQYERAASSPAFGTPTFAGVVQVGGTATGQYYLLSPTLNAPALNLDLTPAQLVAQGIYKVNPATNAPYTFSEVLNIFDLSKAVTLLLGNSKKVLTLSAEHQFNNDVTFFADVLYSQTENFLQLNAQPITDPGVQSHVGSDARNPFNITVRARNRFTDFPRQYMNKTNALRAAGGFRGKINDSLSWEVAFNHNQVDQSYRNKNVVNTANLKAAVANGSVNLFARRQAAGAIENAQIFGTAFSDNVSRLNSIDARVFGDLPIEMPAGPLQFALGTEYRKEGLSAAPDAGSYPDQYGTPVVWTDATSYKDFSAARTVKSVFSEVRIPLASAKQNIPGFHVVDLDLAGRYDTYSDAPNSTVPKVLLRWLPVNDELALRASFSKSFIAPTLFQQNGPNTFGVTGSVNAIRPFGGGAATDLGQLNYKQQANSNLSPQKSTMKNFGVVYSPRSMKGLSLELTYFNLELRDIIGSFPASVMVQDVELRGTASPYAQYFAFGAYSGTPGAVPVTAAGQMTNPPDDIYVTGKSVNIAKQTQSGFDFKVDYGFKLESLGHFDVSLGGTRYSSYKTMYPGIPSVESVGKNEVTNGTIPRWLGNMAVDFSRDSILAGVGFQYVGAVDEVVDTSVVGKQASFVSFDVRAGYDFQSGMLKGLSLRAGVNNVFDKGPPLSTTVNSGINYDTTAYPAATLGRVVYVNASYKF